jgi:hypothetical protein
MLESDQKNDSTFQEHSVRKQRQLDTFGEEFAAYPKKGDVPQLKSSFDVPFSLAFQNDLKTEN